MAREKTYSFNDLSEEAQKRAIEEYREERSWDESDNDQLSEMFEQDIDDYYGLGENMKVNWGLSYTQGDGVCFQGHVDIEKFLEAEPQKNANEKFKKLIRLVSAKIDHESRYCHWNSMTVDVALGGEPEGLLSDEVRHEYEAWDLRVSRKVREWSRRAKAGPKDWMPEPSEEMPKHLKKHYEKAERDWAEIEKLSVEFQEYLEERIQEISREMEKTGYAEIEYHDSDEYITDMIVGNDYKFTLEGELAR